MTLFKYLALCVDEIRRDGPGQMALDEALLESAALPTLRIYRWDGPAVSFGCSQSLSTVRCLHPNLPLVRRWTGGGIVEHKGDWTFSLVVPTGETLATLRPTETYRRIHEALRTALAQLDLPTRLVQADDCRTGAACFTAPALHDIHNAQGEKLCGGAQRRTRRGFLHQGSLQLVAVPEDFGHRLAKTLASAVITPALEASTCNRAKVLRREKYASLSWTEKVP